LSSSGSLGPAQQVMLVLLRFGIGWHLFYEGWGKRMSVNWSSRGFLETATGPFALWFHQLAKEPSRLQVADQIVVWGLLLTGTLLMLGLFARTAAILAIGLLLLIYAAVPPWPDHGFAPAAVLGHELYMNKVLVEMLALGVCVVFDTGRISGLDMLIDRRWRGRARATTGHAPAAGAKS
jgi:thiosulfate dehydrogenase [quinone] large subunit